jgi:hypothetical protein
MRGILTVALIFFSSWASSQSRADNIIIISTDGLRWQEVFMGMDSAIANNPEYNEGDSAWIFEKYWSNDPIERRKKIMPFFWNTIAKKGQVYGNRLFDNKVDNANRHLYSFPGYSEFLCGYVDTAIKGNDYTENPNINVLEYLNRQPKFKGRVAAFTAWYAFDRILNEKRSGFPVISAFDETGGKYPSTNERLINRMRNNSFMPFDDEECLDVFTHYAALEHLRTKRPRVLYIAYGETDEWAHSGFYKSYLNAAQQVDTWIREIWEFIQKDPQYRDKTTLIFTTDHGRGDLVKTEWRSHNSKIKDAYQIWMAAMGPGIKPKGEIKSPVQLYQKQFAQTIAKLLGYTFKANHPVAEPVHDLFK